MKTYCRGCPYNYGDPATEMAYNLGCLPSIYEVNQWCDSNETAWACHSASTCLCHGYAEEHPERIGMPLELVEGIHS